MCIYCTLCCFKINPASSTNNTDNQLVELFNPSFTPSYQKKLIKGEKKYIFSSFYFYKAKLSSIVIFNPRFISEYSIESKISAVPMKMRIIRSMKL